MTPLRSKPVVRRVGKLVVEINQAGIALRRYRGRRRLVFTWEQVAALSVAAIDPITAAGETQIGIRVLRQLLGIQDFRAAI